MCICTHIHKNSTLLSCRPAGAAGSPAPLGHRHVVTRHIVPSTSPLSSPPPSMRLPALALSSAWGLFATSSGSASIQSTSSGSGYPHPPGRQDCQPVPETVLTFPGCPVALLSRSLCCRPRVILPPHARRHCPDAHLIPATGPQTRSVGMVQAGCEGVTHRRGGAGAVTQHVWQPTDS